MADPLRARIVGLLAREQLCTCHLVEETGAKQPTVSHHLRLLREGGLVEASRCGRFTYYRLLPDVLESLSDQFAHLAADARRMPARRPCIEAPATSRAGARPRGRATPSHEADQMSDTDTDHALEHVIDLLCQEFDGVYSRETVAEVVHDSRDSLGKTRLTVYVPLLTHRFARTRLRSSAIVSGAIAKDRPHVLFVCVHNAGRSQMAAALLHHRAKDRVVVQSAGSAPAGEINPLVVEAMREIGIDVSREFPKPLTSETVQASDVVITMGCGDACPVFPGTRYHDWVLDDPADQDLAQIRSIRDEIDRRVSALLEELVPQH